LPDTSLKAVLDLDTDLYDQKTKKAVKDAGRMFNRMERQEKRFSERVKKIRDDLERAKKWNDRQEIVRLRRKLRRMEQLERASMRRRSLRARMGGFFGRDVGAMAGGRFSGLRAIGQSTLGRFAGRGLMAAGRGAIGAGVVAAGASFAIGAKVAKDWIQAAEAFAQFNFQLELLLSKQGQLGEAGKIRAFAERFARETQFTPTEVRGAQTSLIAAGAKTTDLQLLTRRMGELAAFSQVSMTEVVRPIARLFAGDFGEAFERLRDFKISRQDLSGAGLKFTKGGAFTGTSEQAVDAVMKVIAKKFGGVLDQATLTLAGKTNRLVGTFNSLGTSFGMLPLEEIKGGLDSLTSLLERKEFKNVVRRIKRGPRRAID
jgi:hypothetical protein